LNVAEPGQLRVLVVEDDLELCDLLVEAMRLYGRSVLGFARDSGSAIEMLDGGPAVAIVDYNLLDGPCEAVLDAFRLAGVPVAIATAYRPSELPSECLMFPILTKPYGIDALNLMVDELASQLAEQRKITRGSRCTRPGQPTYPSA
jgi:DNA-binding response OmpR family regulator